MQVLHFINEIKPATDSPVTYITGMNVMNQNRNFINEISLGDKDSLRTSDIDFCKGSETGEYGLCGTIRILLG